MLRRAVYLRVLFCIAAAFLGRGILSRAQTPPPQPQDQPAVIRVTSNLVMVPVSVTDSAGIAVKDLKAGDFRIEEDGEPEAVARMDEPGTTPLELALLFDVSGSVHGRFEFERQAASRFLREIMKPKDAVTLFAIGRQPRRIQERTVNVQSALQGLSALEATREATAFFDSVASAVHSLHNTAPAGTRRVAVVVSDGEDNYSTQHDLDDAVRELQHADCLFYSINPSGPSIRLNRVSVRGQKGLERLATETGGAAFLPDRLEELDAIFTRITNELQAQYLLGYYSHNQRMDGGFRKIAVRIPARPELRVRARQGYYASRHPESRASR
jgi:Ca-activated chloride channel family protein